MPESIQRTSHLVGSIMVAALAGLLVVGGGALAQEQQHQHEHSAVPDMDAEGKRLESYQVKHDMDAELIAELREQISLYRGFTDREIHMNMSGMGPNYEWYVSDTNLRGDVGVIILTHGVGENSDRMLRDALRPIGEEQPTAIGFGMAMMMSSHLQSAADDLTERGAKSIILVQNGTTSDFNSLTRQWKYIFNLGEEATYLEVPVVESDARFIMSPPFGDNKLITDVLYDHVREVSKNPANELVIIVGHGPEDVEDNVEDLAILSAHADRIGALNEFADVRMINLQDDAIAPIRKSNVKKLRRWIRKADDKGQSVIVVAVAAASHGVQAHIRTDLQGLNYTFADKGLAEHPKYLEWLETVISEMKAAL